VIALLLAASVVVGPEIATDPLPPRSPVRQAATPAVAMAHDIHGTAIVWTSEDSHGTSMIFFARLDETAHIVGSVHELSKSALVDDVTPSLAASPTGEGFVLAYLEIASSGTNAVFNRLDADLQTSPQFVLTAIGADEPPPVVRSGTSTWIAASGLLWRMRTDGSLEPSIATGVLAADMTAATEWPVLVGEDRIRSANYVCSSQPGCAIDGGPFRGSCYESCRVYAYTVALEIMALNGASTIENFDFDSFAQPAIAGDGHAVVVVRFDGDQQNRGSVVAQTGSTSIAVGTVLPDSGATRPDIAFDGERYLIVWRSAVAIGNHDIEGASIDAAGNVASFPIAGSSADERDPAVLAVGRGRFLVTYDKIDGAERRLAGRFVEFPTRERAVR